jgi:DNA-binding LytR/AlgR family response regulator
MAPPPLRLVVPEVPAVMVVRDRGSPGERLAAHRGESLYFLEPTEIWAFQATGAGTVVHAVGGKYDIDSELNEVQRSFCRPLLRVHASWLVKAVLVRRLERTGGQTTLFVGGGAGEGADGVHVPVAREQAQAVRDALLAGSTGLRPGRPSSFRTGAGRTSIPHAR